MRNFAIARVYASALLELARERGQLKDLTRSLKEFREMLEESRDLRDLFLSPERGFGEKRAVLERVLEGAPELFLNFLLILVRKHREPAFMDIAAAFGYLLDKSESRLRGRLASARPVDDEQRRRIEGALSESTGKEVHLDLEVEEELLAGMVLTLEDQILDGSLRTRLRQMKNRLATVELGKE